MQVVDQDQQRTGLRGGGQQAVGSRGHRQAVGGLRDGLDAAQAERGAQRGGLPFRQFGEAVGQRIQQRVQAGET